MFKHALPSPLYRLLLVLAGPSIALALSLSPAWSLDSGWAETEGGSMRLVVDPEPREDGTIAGYLDIALEPGWKTYWRDPGGAGIPPMLDFSQSEGITFEAIAYPPPVRVDDGYAIWAGYTAPVQFPLTFRRTASDDAHIRAQVFIGICEKICVPFQAELSVGLAGDAIGHDSVRQAVEAAFARLPEMPGQDFSIEKAVVDLNSRQLAVTATLPAFRPSDVKPELFVAGPEGFAFAPPQLQSDEGGRASWSVQIENLSGQMAAGAAIPLDIVVTLGQRAIGQRIEPELTGSF